MGVHFPPVRARDNPRRRGVPAKADQLHDEATGGKASNQELRDGQRQLISRSSCAVCEHEVPLSEAPVREASDYMAHFCGLDCYERWRKLAVAFVSAIR